MHVNRGEKILKTWRFRRSFVAGGALSSAVEHFLHTEGVAGSNPAARTILGDKTAGRVAEWLKAPDSKSGVGASLPEVRILSLPPPLPCPGKRFMICGMKPRAPRSHGWLALTIAGGYS